jgi:hypothetical protein
MTQGDLDGPHPCTDEYVLLHARRLHTAGGPDALTARALATAVGTSTQAI